MQKIHKKIFHIIGRSNSGKTSLIEKLIPYFKESGLEVAILKNTSHDFKGDSPGTDSNRFYQAGARQIGLMNKKKFMMTSVEEKAEPVQLASKYFSQTDIIIIEGNKKSPLPKLEVIGDSKEPPLFKENYKNIKMIASDHQTDYPLPTFKRNEIEKIGQQIIKILS